MLTPMALTVPHLCYLVNVHLSPLFPVSRYYTLSTYYQNDDYCCRHHYHHSPIRVTSSYHLMSSTVCDFYSDTPMRFKVFMFVCVTLSLVSSPTNVHFTKPFLHHNISWYFTDFTCCIFIISLAAIKIYWRNFDSPSLYETFL